VQIRCRINPAQCAVLGRREVRHIVFLVRRVRHGDGEVDDGLRRQTGDGGRADMVYAQRDGSERRPHPGRGRLVGDCPCRIVIDDCYHAQLRLWRCPRERRVHHR
jgi:hypothetical protein